MTKKETTYTIPDVQNVTSENVSTIRDEKTLGNLTKQLP
jgi:hypothetical protein